MVLKNQVEWALHCCSVLAGLPDDVFLATKVLAEFHGVPKEYLSKAMQSLSQAGLVETTLGPRGGYRLARPPSGITFLDIVEAVEGRRSTFQCQEIRKNNPCRPAKQKDSSICAVARVMYRADEAWRKHLKSVRLADLLVTLVQEIPSETLQKSSEWLATRK